MKAATARCPRFRRCGSETNGTPREIPGAGNLAFDVVSIFLELLTTGSTLHLTIVRRLCDGTRAIVLLVEDVATVTT